MTVTYARTCLRCAGVGMVARSHPTWLSLQCPMCSGTGINVAKGLWPVLWWGDGPQFGKAEVGK